MNDQTITIELSTRQRNLLLRYAQAFDDIELLRLIAAAAKKGDIYEIMPTKTQVVYVFDLIAFYGEAENDPKKRRQLDRLWEYLEEYLREIDMLNIFETEASCSKNTGVVYVFKVALEGNAKIWRTIAMCDNQTLDDLHNIIYKAFDRFDEHLYSFYIPHTPKRKRPRRIYDMSTEYKHPYSFQGSDLHGTESHNAATVTIGSLNLQPKQILYYLFDYGDCWWHTVTVEKTDGTADKGNYPRIIESKGKSPEQYPDYCAED